MAEETAPSTVFNLSRLPLELRTLIWEHALADRNEHLLSFYREGCWALRRRSPDDAGYSPSSGDSWAVEFHADRLDRVCVQIPLFSVNREARRIAMVWMRKQGIGLHWRHGRQVFARSMDPRLDALYVAREVVDTIILETWEVRMDHEAVEWPSPAIARIAIPLALIDWDERTLLWIWGCFMRITSVSIIVGKQPDPTQQQQWSLASMPASLFVWNLSRGTFVLGPAGAEIADPELLARIEKAIERMEEGLREMRVPSFDIRLAAAIAG